MIFLLFLLILIPTQAHPFPFFTDYKAHQAFEQNDYKKAQTYLEQQQINAPFSGTINYNLGVVHYKQKHYDQATQSYEHVVSDQSDAGQSLKEKTYFNWGNALYYKTLSILGPSWEKEQIADETLTKAITTIKSSIEKYQNALVISPENNRTKINKKKAEDLRDKLEQKRAQQQAQDQQNKDQNKNKDQQKDQQDNKQQDKNSKDQSQQDNQKQDQQNNKDQNKNEQDKQKSQPQDQGKNQKDKKEEAEQKEQKQDESSQEDDKQNKEAENKDQQEQENEQQKNKHQDSGQKEDDQQTDSDKQEENEEAEQEEQNNQEENQSQAAGQSNEKEESEEQTQGGSYQKGEESTTQENMQTRQMKVLLNKLQDEESALHKKLIKQKTKGQQPQKTQGQNPW